MHLAQHHFQAQCRYLESAMHFALSSAFHGIYGFLSLELDDEALWNGTVSLVRAAGVAPDGLAFDLSDADDLPQTRKVADLLAADQDAVVLHLAVPAYRRDRANCDDDEVASGERRRFRAETVTLFDETTGTDARQVRVGRGNLEILTDSELDDHVVSLPMARVRAEGSGHFVYDPLFVPPVLRVGASARVTALLEGLVEMLEAKGEALASRLPGADSMSGTTARELIGLWLTHTVYAGLAPLRSQLEHGRAHPREVYENLARLAGALCTFSLESEARDLPLYDHDRPGEAFAALDRRIRRHLEVIVPESHLTVRLTRTEPNVHTATLEDKRAIERSEWVLGVRSSASAAAVIAEVPRTVKVCSAEDVMRLVQDANPALPLEHLAAPPGTIAPRVGSHYFRIRHQGRSWDLIRARSSVGVYVPDALPEAELELLIIPE